IIPSTAEEIAGDLGRDDFTNDDVYHPYVNVEFGIYYLSKVMNYVDNQPYAALAGYNGGPGNAMEWLSISGPDLDLFVETITFPETHAYVTRIYEQYNVYRTLYSAP
ncbi:MAG: transglycosylase SLT domain-containing protein, partial [Anaerolineae bacterium]|nr:transglycosylase SLT domain-containing protein [Anaerolineae bacterium]